MQQQSAPQYKQQLFAENYGNFKQYRCTTNALLSIPTDSEETKPLEVFNIVSFDLTHLHEEVKDHLFLLPYFPFLLHLTSMSLHNLTQSKSILSRASACLLYTLEPCIFPSACLKSVIVIGRKGSVPSGSELHAWELSVLLKQ